MLTVFQRCYSSPSVQGIRQIPIPSQPQQLLLHQHGGRVAYKIMQKFSFWEGHSLRKHQQGLRATLSVETSKLCVWGGGAVAGRGAQQDHMPDTIKKDSAKKLDLNSLTEILVSYQSGPTQEHDWCRRGG